MTPDEYQAVLARLSDLDRNAAEVAGVVGWFPWMFEAAMGGVICRGAVCPLKTRGRDKGLPAYRRADRKTMMVVIVTGRLV